MTGNTRGRGRPTITPAVDRQDRPRPKKLEFDSPDPRGPKKGDQIYVWTGNERPVGLDENRIVVGVVTKVLQQGRVAASGITANTIMQVFDDCAPEWDTSERANNAPFRWAPSPTMEMRLWFDKHRDALDALLVSSQGPTDPPGEDAK